MAVKQECCSVPQGRFYIGEYGGVLQKALPTGGVITPQLSLIQNAYLGATEEGKLNLEFEEPMTSNMETRGGGIGCYVKYLKSAMLEISVVCNTAESASLATFGTVREFAGGAVTGETHAVIKNATSTVSSQSKNTFIPFNRIPDPSIAYVITNIGATVTYVEGTDYTKVESGIEVLPGSTIANSVGPAYVATIVCGYTAVDTQRNDGLTVLQKNHSVFLDGFDRMSGSSRQWWFYNARGSVKTLPTKSKDVVKLDFMFMLLPDSRIPYTTNNPTSQYFHQLNS